MGLIVLAVAIFGIPAWCLAMGLFGKSKPPTAVQPQEDPEVVEARRLHNTRHHANKLYEFSRRYGGYGRDK